MTIAAGVWGMVTVRLLGPPAIEHDGRPARPPRGRKAWALLAYLLLAPRPPGRGHLAELLFADAADPLGALRWTLAELRRALGAPGALTGDPVVAGLDGVTTDLRLVMSDAAGDEPLPDHDGELLEGLRLPSSPAFESWLLAARHRVAARIEARLRETAAALLAAGRAGEAVAYASRAVARNPLDEGNHELLVRSLVATGDRMAARRQVKVTTALLRRETGPRSVPPTSTSPFPVMTGMPGRAGLPVRNQAEPPGPVPAKTVRMGEGVAGAVEKGVTGAAVASGPAEAATVGSCLRRWVAWLRTPTGL